MRVGIPKETYPGERRVAATPATVQKLKKLGVEVSVQAGAGAAADFNDGAYAEAGATILANADELWAAADLVLKVRPPTTTEGDGHEADRLREGACLVGFVWPGQNKALVDRLAARGATVLAMDAVPRTSRAQKMDALSAMANVAGYRAVVEAASHYAGFFGGQMTAAGRVRPAQVLVVGAGVAGLAAVAAARALGAVVRAFDTRAATREQVESLGASFVEFRFDEVGEGEGGYAKQMSEAYLAAEQALIAQHAKEVDVVITTALVPGKPAPQLLTSGAVVSMRPGSVVVDLAAEQGGNCALTERDQVVERFGIKVVGYTDLTSRMARQASELFAMTVYNLVSEMIRPGGEFRVDLEDEVHRGAIVLDRGTLMWPPPTRPQPRSGAPRPEAKPPAPKGHGRDAHDRGTPVALLALAAFVFVALGLVAPPELLQHLTVFLLACVVGWNVVWNVSPALHTPLMSVTNAISGIILIGGVVLVPAGGVSVLLGAIAVLIASINVAGGFLVTQRMLRMFRR